MRNITKHALIAVLLIFNLEAQTLESSTKPFYQGEIITTVQGGAYTYIKIKEKTHKSFWIATNSADAKMGDFIRFQKEIVVENFKSKTLDRVFKELMFASNLQYRVKK